MMMMMMMMMMMSNVFNAGPLIRNTVRKWNQIRQLISNRKLVFEERENRVPGEKLLEVENRTNKLNPHMTLSLGTGPRPQVGNESPHHGAIPC